jgi:hypothetical protein
MPLKRDSCVIARGLRGESAAMRLTWPTSIVRCIRMACAAPPGIQKSMTHVVTAPEDVDVPVDAADDAAAPLPNEPNRGLEVTAADAGCDSALKLGTLPAAGTLTAGPAAALGAAEPGIVKVGREEVAAADDAAATPKLLPVGCIHCQRSNSGTLCKEESSRHSERLRCHSRTRCHAGCSPVLKLGKSGAALDAALAAAAVPVAIGVGPNISPPAALSRA